MPTIQLQQWTKDRLDNVRDAEAHTSYDSAVKALLRDRQLVSEVLSETPNARAIGPTTRQLALDGGTGDLSLPEPGESLALIGGKTDSGKTVTAAYQAHRLLDNRDDVTVVALDPHDSFAHFAETHESKTIHIGPHPETEMAVNPLEIHSPATPSESAAPTDQFDRKLHAVNAFFRSLVRSESQPSPLSPILDAATIKAYERAGIDHDQATHSEPSPTITDVRGVLADMADDPATYATLDHSSEIEAIESNAGQALIATQPFDTGGQYDWLSRETEFLLSDVPFTRLVLPSVTNSEEQSLLTHALLTAITQQAARLSGETIFILDEAHSFLDSELKQETLARHVRNSCVSNVGYWAVTQSFDRLSATDAGTGLMSLADRMYLHKPASRPDLLQRALDLNDEQTRFLQNAATPGKDSAPQLLMRDPSRSWYPYAVEIPDSVLEQIDTRTRSASNASESAEAGHQ